MVPVKICKRLAKIYLNRLDRDSIVDLMTEIEDLSGLNGQYKIVCRELKTYLDNERESSDDVKEKND